MTDEELNEVGLRVMLVGRDTYADPAELQRIVRVDAPLLLQEIMRLRESLEALEDTLRRERSRRS